MATHIVWSSAADTSCGVAKLLSLLILGALTLLTACGKSETTRVLEASPTASPNSLASPTPNKPFSPSPALPTLTDLEKRPADFFVDGNHLSVQGFTFQKRRRKDRTDFYEQGKDPRNWVDTEYVVVTKGKQVVEKFDAGVDHPHGNSANFGLFPFLGRGSRQVFISEDLPRGGCQWIVKLSPRFRVIFDGQALGVGREGPDLSAGDLDGDGVYEIIAPITDFYQFQDKLYIGAIPLPDIIFKYDSAKQKYLPANPIFKDRVFERLVEVPELDKDDSFNFQHRSVVLSNLLIHVYAGEQKRGWEGYEKYYKLEDKAEMKRRVKAILRDQPVYKLIYHRYPGH